MRDFMNKKQLQTLIESNVRSVLAEEKRKIILEQKMNKLLQEAKKVKKQKAMLRESIRTKKVSLLFINESIQFHEGIWDSIRRGIKGVFGSGLSPDDLKAPEEEKELAAKQKKVVDDEEKQKRKDSKILEIGGKIDDLYQILNSKFISNVSRLPDQDDLEELNSATNEVYELINSIRKPKEKTGVQSPLILAREKALISIKTVLDRLEKVKTGIEKNLENQREKLTNLVTKAEEEISKKFNKYSAELGKLEAKEESIPRDSFRALMSPQDRAPASFQGGGSSETEPAAGVAGLPVRAARRTPAPRAKVSAD